MKISVRTATEADIPEWATMRCALWPDTSAAEHEADFRADLVDPDRICFMAEDPPTGRLMGFLEASVRSVADGCATGPVGYIEGWYVRPEERGRGIGRALVRALEEWARSRGFSEVASDVEIENEESIQAHLRLGFTEIDRVVQFAKRL